MPIPPSFVFDVCHAVYVSVRADLEGIALIDPTKVPSDHLWRSHSEPNGQEYIADFSLACKRALEGARNAPRLILCRLYFLQLMEYEQARNYMGIREDVWSAWSDEIKAKVGNELMHRGMFPPKKYFGERSGRRKANAVGKPSPYYQNQGQQRQNGLEVVHD